MFFNSRKSREKRENPGPMNLSHTDLTNLTDGASLRPRLSALPSALSRMVHTSASDVCFREICEICVSKNKNSIMRKANPMQAINHKEKAKTSRNRGCVMKYPWMRDEISAII